MGMGDYLDEVRAERRATEIRRRKPGLLGLTLGWTIVAADAGGAHVNLPFNDQAFVEAGSIVESPEGVRFRLVDDVVPGRNHPQIEDAPMLNK